MTSSYEENGRFVCEEDEEGSEMGEVVSASSFSLESGLKLFLWILFVETKKIRHLRVN